MPAQQPRPQADRTTNHPASRGLLLLASAFFALPAVIFYSLLSRTTLNLPILDDYNAILQFLNRWSDCRTPTEKLDWFLSSQLVEMKPFLVRTIALTQYEVLGSIDFRVLSFISVALVSLLVLTLWKMFLPSRSDLSLRVALFLPVSFLLFQLQYMTELDVVTESIAHFGVLLFSFLAICMLHRETTRSFMAGCACMVLAIASHANGFLLIPIGLLILFRSRRYRHAGVFAAIAIFCIAAYAYHYDRHVSPTGADQASHSLWTSILLRFLYGISFLGSAGGFNAHFLYGGLLIGFPLIAFFAWKFITGRARSNPPLYHCVLFLLLTAALAASGRSGLGLAQSLSGRYTLYSLVAIALFWMIVVQDSLATRPHPLQSGIWLAMLLISALFSLSWDAIGLSAIRARNDGLTAAILRFEHPSAADPDPFPVPAYQFPGPNGVAEGLKLRQDMRAIMKRSIELGIYRPHF